MRYTIKLMNYYFSKGKYIKNNKQLNTVSCWIGKTDPWAFVLLVFIGSLLENFLRTVLHMSLIEKHEIINHAEKSS